MDLTNLNKDRKTKRKPALDLSTMVYGKVPPQAKELEEAVLGAVMLEKSAFDAISEILRPECFYVDSHQRIFRTMQSLTAKSLPIDLLTVVEELKMKEELEMVGGAYYVTRLTNTVVSTANIEAHARIILQKFLQRELIRISGETAKFGQPEVNLGIIPGYGGTQRMTQLVGKGRAFELLMTGKMINGAEAYRIGLVNQLGHNETLVDTAVEIIHSIAAKAPLAVGYVVDSINAVFEDGVDGYQTEIDGFAPIAELGVARGNEHQAMVATDGG